MINWRIQKHRLSNPVEVIDLDTNKVVLRVYDWSQPEGVERKNSEIAQHRFIQNLKKAGMIILAVKMLEVN